MDMIEEKKKFLDNFIDKIDDVKLTPLQDAFGFSIVKRSGQKKEGFASLFSIYIKDEDLKSDEIKKRIHIRATYGQWSDNGVTVRNIEKSSLSDPVDWVFNDYYYHIKTGQIFKKRKEISGVKLFDDVWNRHIKTSRKFRGFYIRLKLLFWRKLLKNIFYLISRFFYSILWLVSGDKYEFEPILGRTKVNGKLVRSNFPPDEEEIKKNLQDTIINKISPNEDELDIFGYRIAYWKLIFYSWIHLLIFILFYGEEIKSDFMSALFKHSFLVFIYLILSLWLTDRVIPFVLRKLVNGNSKLAIKSLYKKIKI